MTKKRKRAGSAHVRQCSQQRIDQTLTNALRTLHDYLIMSGAISIELQEPSMGSTIRASVTSGSWNLPNGCGRTITFCSGCLREFDSQSLTTVDGGPTDQPASSGLSTQSATWRNMQASSAP